MVTQERDPHYEATHDALTGLLNRRGLTESLHSLIEQRAGEFAVGIIDLEGLKTINDTEGHAKGDELIQQTGVILQQITRSNPKEMERVDTDVVLRGRTARTGGDEFVILFTGIENEGELNAALGRIGTELKTSRIEAAYGGVVHQVGMDEETLLQTADANMYANKQESKLRKYSAEQLDAIRHLGNVATEYGIDLRDVPFLLSYLRKND